MTISNITVGTASTNVNASVTPGAPSGLAVGDLVIIHAAIRATTSSPNLPTGWKLVGSNANGGAVFGKIWATGDTMPTVTFSVSVANADTYARAFKCRDFGPDALAGLTAVSQVNASAQNIAYPALDVPGRDHLLALMVHKFDDATSLSTPASWTAQGLTSQVTGDDQLAALYTWLQTTETDVAAGSITVTGGVAAVSDAFILAIKSTAAITVQSLNLFPPRTQISVTSMVINDALEIYRVVAGERTLLRNGKKDQVTDPSYVVVDGELPFGIPVKYEAVINGVAVYTSSTASYAPPGGKVILSDAVTGDASEFIITAWDEKAYDTPNSVFTVGGRNVVVIGQVGLFEATLRIYFDAYSSSTNFKALLTTATEGILQLRSPDSVKYEGVNSYLSIINAKEKRFSQDGSDPRREWELTVVETEAWSDGQIASGFTLQDIATKYAGLTLANYAADYPTLLAAAQADYS